MNQLSIDFDAAPPRARHTDPETSHAAAARATPTAGKLDNTICEALQAGPQTTHEISARTGIPVVSVSPRIKPLRVAGRVVDTLERRDGRSVWALA